MMSGIIVDGVKDILGRYYGASSLEYTDVREVGNVRTYTLQNLPAGTYYFAITAYDSAGNETAFSPEVKKNIP